MQIVSMLADGGVVVAGLGLTALIFWTVTLILSVFWVWMLIDCLASNQPPMEKLIWFLVILFLHIFGALLYYFIARKGPRAGIA